MKIDLNLHAEEIFMVLLTLREDATMALEGTWDCTTPGFEDQINLIDNLLDKLNK